MNHIQKILYQHFASYIKEIVILPFYIFERNPERRFQYDILLTTDQEVLYVDKSFYLMNPLILTDDVEKLGKIFSEQHKKKLWDNHLRIKNKYLTTEEVENKKDTFISIDQVIGYTQDGTFSYHMIGNGLIYIGKIVPSITSMVKIYTLDWPVVYLHKKITKIVFAQFRQGEDHVFEFFDAISELINIYK